MCIHWTVAQVQMGYYATSPRPDSSSEELPDRGPAVQDLGPIVEQHVGPLLQLKDFAQAIPAPGT